MQRTAANPEAKHAAYMKKLQDYYVHCAATGEKIAVPDLKYWNVEKQEPYKDAETGLSRYTPTTGCA